MALRSWATLALSFAPAAFVAAAVHRKSKTVAALAQLGGLQTRESTRQQLKDAAIEVDKLWFLLSTMNIGLTAFIVGHAPHLYFLYFTPKTVCLIALRWWSFRKRGQHYFLWDFCYWANFALLYFVWLDPHNEYLFRALFMCANGPVAFSVLCFNHAMIFHSFPHVTSAVIHLSPMILTYGLRWHAADAVGGGALEALGLLPGGGGGGGDAAPMFTVCPPAAEGGCDGVTYLGLLRSGLLGFYVWWLVIYYVWIFVVLGSYIERKGYVMLWDRFLTMKPWGPPLQRVMAARGKLVAQAAYMLLHLSLGAATMAVVAVVWYSQAAHFTLLCVLGGATLRNGGDFYLSVFEAHYASVLEQQQRPASGAPLDAAAKKVRGAGAGLKLADPKGC